MAYTTTTYKDMQDAIDNANNLLESYGKEIELSFLHQHGLFGLSSINLNNGEQNTILEPINIDSCYNWLAGFNTAIMNEYFSNTITLPITRNNSFLDKIINFFK